MVRVFWAPAVESFMDGPSSFDFDGRRLDLRENVSFKGGNLSRWIHENYPEAGCSLSIDFKKFFMDEWTGRPDPDLMETIVQALSAAAPGVIRS